MNGDGSWALRDRASHSRVDGAASRGSLPAGQAPRCLLRDRDRIYGMSSRRLVRNMGIKEALIAPRSPYQNLYVERVISSIRRDLLDRVIVLSERYLMRLLTQYMAYDHQYRTHLSLTMDGRESRPLSTPTKVMRQGPR